jgi:DNA-binding transcriptional ArsR family regulator
VWASLLVPRVLGGTQKGRAVAKRKRKQRPLVSQRFVKALANELRVEILAILTERVASPKELTQELTGKLPSVSYHVRVLYDYELITLVDTEPRRGAVEHFYRATARTLLPAQEWRGIEGGLRTAIGAGLANELFDGLAEAIEANKLTEADTHIGLMPLVLDAEGWENVRASAELFSEKVEAEQAASTARVAEASEGGNGVKGYTFGVLAFEDSRDLSVGVHKGDVSKSASANDKPITGRGKDNGGRKSRNSRDPKDESGAK